jgi:hypothetical protein
LNGKKEGANEKHSDWHGFILSAWPDADRWLWRSGQNYDHDHHYYDCGFNNNDNHNDYDHNHDPA